MAKFDVFSRNIDLAPHLQRLAVALSRRPTTACLWLGVALRLWVYAQGRPYWMDEGSLLSNLQGVGVLDFSGPLRADQLAPPGFLAAERLLILAFGASPYVGRLIPLACGLASLWLFRSIAERIATRPAAFLAMFLFAICDDLVYYSNELKPYSVDLAIGLLLTAMSLRALHAPAVARRRLTRGLAVVAVVSPWFSFASVFVAAGCGMVLLADRLRAGDRAEAVRWLGVGAIWAVSVLVVPQISRRLLAAATSMYVFWDFAFLPAPPLNGRDAAKALGILLETLVTPLNLIPTLLPYAFAVAVLAMLVQGARRIGRRDLTTLAVLITPLVLALAASAARRYPFHGRLILWLAPALFLMIAEGAQEIRYRRGRTWYAAALAFLLYYPTVSTLYEAVPPHYREFNRHGDLRRNRFME